MTAALIYLINRLYQSHRAHLALVFLLCLGVSILSPVATIVKAEPHDNVYRGVELEFDGDNQKIPLDLGFEFPYFDQTFKTIDIYTDGLASFNQYLTLPNKNTDLPSYDLGPTLLPFWQDLNIDQSKNQKVYYKNLGEAPNRQLLIQWTNPSTYLDPTSEIGIFQVILNESGQITFQYPKLNDFGGSATVGINQDSSSAFKYSYHQTSLVNRLSINYIPDNFGGYKISDQMAYQPVFINNSSLCDIISSVGATIDSPVKSISSLKISDSEGNPLANTRIELTSTNQATYTDKLGNAQFINLADGEHDFVLEVNNQKIYGQFTTQKETSQSGVNLVLANTKNSTDNIWQISSIFLLFYVLSEVIRKIEKSPRKDKLKNKLGILS